MPRLRRFALAALSASVALGKSIVQFPSELRERNVIRVSREACDECATLEDFYASNPLAFVLFYERALVGAHKYKQAVISGFHEACADLRWSILVCGAVDMLEDKEYAARYIDPKTAPAHIAVRDGQPVPMEKRHVDRLMQKPGDKPTMLWHLRDLLTPGDDSPSAFDVSTEVAEAEALDRVLRRHEVVVVAAVESGERPARRILRSAAQRLVLTGAVPRILNTSTTEAARRSKKKRVPLEQGRLLFVVASGAKTLSARSLSKGDVVAFLRGQPLDVGKQVLPAKGLDEPKAAAALRSALAPALQALAEEVARSAAEAGPEAQPPPPPKARRRRRRAGKGTEL